MPTTLVGLAAFIALLAPGLTFTLARERRYPERKLSTFRETISLAFAGIGCDVAVLGLFGLFRWWQPTHTPNVGEVLFGGDAYLREHLAYIAVWAVGLLVLACVLGILLGQRSPRRAGVLFESAWYTLFSDAGNDRVYVGCELDDGSYVGGELYTYSTEIEETADRELTIRAPVQYRPAGSEESGHTLPNVGAVAVSARRIKFLTVTYLDPQASASPTGSSDG